MLPRTQYTIVLYKHTRNDNYNIESFKNKQSGSECGRSEREMAATEPVWDEEKLKRRYLRISKLILLFAIIYTLWIAIVIIGTFFMKLGISWASFTVEQWVLSAIALFVIFIIIELLFFVQLSTKKLKKKRPKKVITPAQFIKGKRVHTFTLPFGARGGIFSKTYITIDDRSVLNLRYQITAPNQLWGKKQ